MLLQAPDPSCCKTKQLNLKVMQGSFTDRWFFLRQLNNRSVILTFSVISTDRCFCHRLKSPIGNFNHVRYFHRSVIITGPTWGELVGRVDVGAKRLVTPFTSPPLRHSHIVTIRVANFFSALNAKPTPFYCQMASKNAKNSSSRIVHF